MATISFDREFRIPKESMDRFIAAIEKEPRPIFDPPNIEEEMKESETMLENVFSFSTQATGTHSAPSC
nr:MAG TPA: hypothetical protein [Siphoviridae sp. ctELO16]